MKYYLVALFDDESYKSLTPIQRNLSKKFRANKNSPLPYIPLEIVENPSIDKLDLLVEKIIRPYKNFKIKFFSKVSISENTRSLSIIIEDKGYIKRLSRLLNDTLNLHGFNIKNMNNDSPMYISIANLNYISNDMKNLNSEVSFKTKLDVIKVNRIELWKISNNKRETLVKSYPLKQS